MVAEVLEDQRALSPGVIVERDLGLGGVHVEPVDVVDGSVRIVRRVEAASLVRKLRLEVHAQFVGRLERRFRRTPRVEPIVVHAVRLGDAQHAEPARLVHRRIARQREDGAVELAAKIGRPTVDGELRPTRREVPQAEAHVTGVGQRFAAASLGIQVHRQADQRRVELVPQRGLVAEREDGLDRPALAIDFHREALPGEAYRLGRVERSAGDFQRALDGLAGRVADGRLDHGRAIGDVRIDLHVAQPDRVLGMQLDAPDDAIPVRLRPLVHRVGRPDRRELGVVDEHRNRVLARRHRLAHVENLQAAERVLPAAERLVDPHAGVLAALQQQADVPALPPGRDGHVALIPGGPLPVPHPAEAVVAVLILENALVVLVGRAGQLDGVIQSACEPLLTDALVVGVQRETPLACQRHHVRRRLFCRGRVAVER